MKNEREIKKYIKEKFGYLKKRQKKNKIPNTLTRQ